MKTPYETFKLLDELDQSLITFLLGEASQSSKELIIEEYQNLCESIHGPIQLCMDRLTNVLQEQVDSVQQNPTNKTCLPTVNNSVLPNTDWEDDWTWEYEERE